MTKASLAQLSPPRGEDIMSQLKQAGVGIVVSVPILLRAMGSCGPYQHPDFRLIRVCKEDKGYPSAPPLHSNTRAVLLMQQTGLAGTTERDQGYCHGLSSTGLHDSRFARQSCD